MDIPESINMEVPVYTIPELSAPRRIRVLIDVDFDSNQIYFKPAPGELENAMLATQQVIHELLIDGQETPVFFGSP